MFQGTTYQVGSPAGLLCELFFVLL